MSSFHKTERPRLYGRSKGRPLRSHQQVLMNELYPKLIYSKQCDLSQFQQVWMEIGFGGAEHLLHIAKENPETAIIGAEPFLNGVAKAVSGIAQNDLKNLFLYNGDARDILDHMSTDFLDRLYILFPDPWPKARHNKRRIINELFLDEVVRVLKPGGKLYFASDISDYVDWAVTRLKRNGRFSLLKNGPATWRQPYPYWPGTRYEAKAIRAGRLCHYLMFQTMV